MVIIDTCSGVAESSRESKVEWKLFGGTDRIRLFSASNATFSGGSGVFSGAGVFVLATDLDRGFLLTEAGLGIGLIARCGEPWKEDLSARIRDIRARSNLAVVHLTSYHQAFRYFALWTPARLQWLRTLLQVQKTRVSARQAPGS